MPKNRTQIFKNWVESEHKLITWFSVFFISEMILTFELFKESFENFYCATHGQL